MKIVFLDAQSWREKYLPRAENGLSSLGKVIKNQEILLKLEENQEFLSDGGIQWCLIVILYYHIKYNIIYGNII